MKIFGAFLIFITCSYSMYCQDMVDQFLGEIIPLASLKCACDSTQLEQVKSQLSIGEEDQRISQLNEIYAININQNAVCEFLLIYSSTLLAKNIVYEVVEINQHNQLSSLGVFLGKINFIKSTSDYLGIVEPFNNNHRTNPAFYPQEFAFNGDKYESKKIIKTTHSIFQSRGKVEYDYGNYELAAKYYNNALLTASRIKRAEIKIANDLAVTLIKLGQYEYAKLILEETITTRIANRDKAVSYYNLGLIYQKMKDVKNALYYFEESNLLERSEIKEKKIEELKNQ